MQQDVLSRPSGTASGPGDRLQRLLFRKIWLPRSAYAALPYLYIFLGLYAMAAALYLRHWSWIIPYLLLVGIGGVHAGAVVLSLRWRNRKKDSAPHDNLPE